MLKIVRKCVLFLSKFVVMIFHLKMFRQEIMPCDLTPICLARGLSTPSSSSRGACDDSTLSVFDTISLSPRPGFMTSMSESLQHGTNGHGTPWTHIGQFYSAILAPDIHNLLTKDPQSDHKVFFNKKWVTYKSQCFGQCTFFRQIPQCLSKYPVSHTNILSKSNKTNKELSRYRKWN